MDCFRITGGRPLAGEVAVSGAKNAALPIMAAAILAEAPVRLRRVPELVDVATLSQVLGQLGVRVERAFDGSLEIETIDSAPTKADYELVRRMRASFCVLGPLLARRGKGVVSLPGGCNIGVRPVDLHLKGFAALGADIRIEHGYVIAQARRLRGASIDLGGPHGPTVTGTANVMSAAVRAEGVTRIRGAAVEPEIVDLGNFLQALGADISGLGTPEITVRGVDALGGACYTIIPDRIEAGTLLIAAAITRGSATISQLRPEHSSELLRVLQQTGAKLTVETDRVSIRAEARPRSVDITATAYPGVPTDLQAQLMALLCTGHARSCVRDNVFHDRFMHVAELTRLGANIQRNGPAATVQGVERLTGANVMASDLRASAALVLAGLAAEGTTIVRRIYHLDRGYERLERKLNSLGACIERLPEKELA